VNGTDAVKVAEGIAVNNPQRIVGIIPNLPAERP
jgi:hypothetical protein